MLDPTGWGTVIIDALRDFFISFLGGLLLRLFEFVRNVATTILSGIATTIKNAVSGVFEFFGSIFQDVRNMLKTIWDFCANVFDIIAFVADTLRFLRDIFEKSYKFIVDFFQWVFGENDEFGGELWKMFQDFLTWIGDFFVGLWERAQSFTFDNALWLYEWGIGILDRMVGYFVGLIQTIFDVTGIKIDLPAGAVDAVAQFINWGMLFNQILPIKELFQLLGIYLLCVVMLSLVRFIRSMIPFVK
jgi:phage-related protein